jgi:hypothetical protein
MHPPRFAATAPELCAPEHLVTQATEFPHDVGAERRLLGAMLIDGSVYPRVRDIVQPRHFSLPLLGLIYEAFARRAEGGEAVNAAALGNHSYLHGFTNEVIHVLNAEDDACRIRQHYLERERIAASICGIGDVEVDNDASPFCPDLNAEFEDAMSRVERGDFDALVAFGVPERFLWHGPMRFGVATIECARDGRYQPHEHGRRAFIVPAEPVADVFAESADDISLQHEPGDLIAFFLDDPATWYLRFSGMALLNPGAALRPLTLPSRLPVRFRVWSTPLDWLRAAGDGVCVIDPRCLLPLWLGNDLELVADSLKLARELKQLLMPSERRKHRILVDDGMLQP